MFGNRITYIVVATIYENSENLLESLKKRRLKVNIHGIFVLIHFTVSPCLLELSRKYSEFLPHLLYTSEIGNGGRF
jgi:hypothetical protein